MRKLIYTTMVAFTLGGLAPLAHAGEGCDYSGKAAKKNDMETPAPAASTTATKKQG